jgi:hypothetical protein
VCSASMIVSPTHVTRDVRNHPDTTLRNRRVGNEWGVGKFLGHRGHLSWPLSTSPLGVTSTVSFKRSQWKEKGI